MRGLRRLAVVMTVLAGAVMCAQATGARGSGGSLTLAVYPGTLVPGGSGAVAATFTNNTSITLAHVVVHVTLPAPASFDAADSSPVCHGSAQTVECSLAGVHEGTAVLSTIAFTGGPASGPVSFSSKAAWNKDTISFTLSAPVLATGGTTDSTCAPHEGTASADQDGYGSDVTAGANTLGLTCTPIATGIDNSDIAFVKIPPLKVPASVVLTFPDHHLPWPAGNRGYPVPADRDPWAPTELTEYPSYPSLAGPVSVPWCDPGAMKPPAPLSTDSCIVSITGTDDDADSGTVTLRVQGSATGDPGYHG